MRVASKAAPTYPPTRGDPVVEDHFGTPVPDPYRWLEAPDGPERQAWIEAQNALTFAYLESIPERRRLRERLTELWDFERCSAPDRHGPWFLFGRNDGLQDQAVIHRTRDLDADPDPLLDPNALSADGSIAVADVAVTRDGRYLAYALASAGSDWHAWHVREVASGRDLPDVVRWSKFSGAAWLPDGSGFVYGRYEPPAEPGAAFTEPNHGHRLFLHRLGTDQDADELVFERPDQPDWGFDASVTDDGRWLLVTQTEGTEPKCRLFVRDLAAPGSVVEPFLDAFDASYEVVGNDGECFYVLTDRDAPRRRLVAIERGRPQPAAWAPLIREGRGREVLASVVRAAGRFVALWRVDAHDRLRIHRLDGGLEREVNLPGMGTVSELAARPEDGEARLVFTSYTRPPTVYRLDVASGTMRAWRAPRLAFDPDAYETRQVFYPSRDGTAIPMFITARRAVARDGSNPTYLHGYGGFDIALTPGFDPAVIAWLELGGTYAVANLRGGAEYGREWHEAGRLGRKQNVFDDAIAAAEHLVADGWTTPSRLAIGGRSNGGLLVGACLTQRPDLFGAALPAVGVLDMLRFHRFTIGWAWTSDYGDPEVEADFRILLAYSPLHNLRPGTRYPATLITTADHDDRVVPAHSFKFAAALQAAQAGPAPVLIRIEQRAGHGSGRPTHQLIEEAADRWAFLLANLEAAT